MRRLNRPVTAGEVAVIRWLLDHAAVGDVTPYKESIESLLVFPGCDCGCPSLDFAAEA